MDAEFLRYKFCDGGPESVTNSKYRVGIRHVQLVYMFGSTAVAGLLRGAAGIGVLAMADTDRVNDDYIQVFPWSPSMQGTLLTSFLLGYALMLVPAELYLKKISGKVLVAAALLTDGAVYGALPTIAKKGGFLAVLNSHFILGMTQACMVPANLTLLHRWLPPSERKIMSGIIFSGFQIGLIFSYPLFSTLAAAPLGWELVYYASAMLTLSVGIVWAILTSASPEEHPAIGEKEAEYLQEAMKGIQKKIVSPPWREMLRSRALWATTFAHIGTNVVFVSLLVDAPLYTKYALRMPLEESGWYMMLPFTLMFLTHKTVAPTVQWAYNSGFLSYLFSGTMFRKIMNGFGAFGTILGLISLSYIGPEKSTQAIVVMTFTMTMSVFQYTGFLENHKDISPNFSGSLMMISSTVSSIIGAFVPIISGAILNADVSSPVRWRVVHLSLATLCVASALLYTALGSADRQPWDQPTRAAKFGYHNEVNHLELEDLQTKIAIQEEEEDLF